MIYCAFWSILGAIGITAAPNFATILVFRFFQGMGSWGFLSVGELSTNSEKTAKMAKAFISQPLLLLPNSRTLLTVVSPPVFAASCWAWAMLQPPTSASPFDTLTTKLHNGVVLPV